jgi:hypothetical protein
MGDNIELVKALLGPAFEGLLGPRIDGIEVTQAIQYYKAHLHLTDANDWAPDNSARLVAYKPAWVRVYVRAGPSGGSPVLSGELVIERGSKKTKGAVGPPFHTVATLAPAPPGTVTAEVAPDWYVAERANIDASLNFIVPADTMWGFLRLTIRVWHQGGTSASALDTRQRYVDATLRQTLRLRGVFFSYNGPNAAGTGNLSYAAPTLADLQNTSAWMLTTSPVESVGEYSSAGTREWSKPFTDSDEGCGPEWDELNQEVTNAKTEDGNRTDVIYYGLLPADTPVENTIGCSTGAGGVASSRNGFQSTMAHEACHVAGLMHAPCGDPDNVDPNYPAYEPYDNSPNTPTASIGEFGLDINNGTIHLPQGNKDHMSYCTPEWISLYHLGSSA